LSSSKDLTEYNGDLGSRLCTSMSCLDVTRPVRTIFCNNDFSEAGNSLSSSLDEGLFSGSADGTLIFPDSRRASDNCAVRRIENKNNASSYNDRNRIECARRWNVGTGKMDGKLLTFLVIDSIAKRVEPKKHSKTCSTTTTSESWNRARFWREWNVRSLQTLNVQRAVPRNRIFETNRRVNT